MISRINLERYSVDLSRLQNEIASTKNMLDTSSLSNQVAPIIVPYKRPEIVSDPSEPANGIPRYIEHNEIDDPAIVVWFDKLEWALKNKLPKNDNTMSYIDQWLQELDTFRHGYRKWNINDEVLFWLIDQMRLKFKPIQKAVLKGISNRDDCIRLTEELRGFLRHIGCDYDTLLTYPGYKYDTMVKQVYPEVEMEIRTQDPSKDNTIESIICHPIKIPNASSSSLRGIVRLYSEE